MDKLLLPRKPGVYIMRSKTGEVLYIGKAKNIAVRVQQYFRESSIDSRGWLLPNLLPLISKIDYIVAASERDALVLESKLIKKYQPFFNSAGKDDKSYPYIKITNEDFPRAVLVRKKLKDGADYIGPYPNSGEVKSLLRFLWKTKYAPTRPCKHSFSLARPLARHKINICVYYHTGQCPAPCAGKISKQDYAEIVGRVKMFALGSFEDLKKDITHKMKDSSKNMEYESAAVYRNFLNGLEHMQERIVVGQYKEEKIAAAIKNSEKATRLAEVLALPKPPLHIEAFDNSHLFGKHAVGCMVCFINGKKHTAHYRRFRIQTPQALTGGDDFAMMEEIIYRRLRALKKTPQDKPDLMLVDGGKGQLQAALGASARAGVKMTFAALAEREEEIFIPGQKDSIRLKLGDPALNLLVEIRNEVHRFALAYHTLLRSKNLLK